MRAPEELLRFVKEHRGERVLSVYVDGTAADPAERRHWRVELRQGIAREREALTGADRDERTAFEQCVAAVEARLPEREEMPGVPGLSILCSTGGDLLSGSFPARVHSSVTWRDGPRILPWLLAIAESPAALVVMIDRHGATISRLLLGTLQAVESIASGATKDVGPHMGDFPRHGFHGGTRGETQTDALQRQLREVHDRLVAATVRRLTALANGGSFVVLGGAAEAAAHLISALPPALATRTVIADALTVHTPVAAIPAAAHDALIPLLAALQRRRLDEFQRRAHANGHAAFGVESMAAAAELGAIEELILSETLCGERADEVEPIVQQAFLEGASVELATPAASAVLDAACGGAAAKLRFALAGVGAESAAPRTLVTYALR